MEFGGGVAGTQGLVVDKWFLAIECRFVGDRPAWTLIHERSFATFGWIRVQVILWPV